MPNLITPFDMDSPLHQSVVDPTPETALSVQPENDAPDRPQTDLTVPQAKPLDSTHENPTFEIPITDGSAFFTPFSDFSGTIPLPPTPLTPPTTTTNPTPPPTPPSQSNPPTEALEWRNGNFPDGVVIDIYFAQAGTTVADGGRISGGPQVTSEGFTPAEIATIMEIYNGISDFADITFRRTFSQNFSDMQLARADLGGNLLGYMYPQGTSGGLSDGVGVMNSNPTFWNATTLQRGGGMYTTLAHEIGHGLGLAHPHDAGGTSQVMDGVDNAGDTGDHDMNQTAFTVMSYNEGWNGHPLGTPTEVDGSGHLSGYGALDMSVLQQYYGVNTTHAAGNDTYILGQNAYYLTLWDTGGLDEIQTTGSANSVIDLRAATLASEVGGGGFVSYTANVMGGFTIANGVVIENATGGSGNDSIRGNVASNRLAGGAGNDTLTGAEGNDSLYGGSGADQVFGGAGNDYVRVGGGAESFYGGAGHDYISYYSSSNGVTINLATNTVSRSWAVNDVIDSFESASGSRTGNDRITGTSGENTIRTYGGDDRVYAGGGADVVLLGDGNDYVRVGGGAESFYGGSGHDYLSYYSSSNGVTVDLAANTVSRSWAVNDTIDSFESVSGSRTGHDRLYGTGGENTLRGYGGNDRLYGRSGDDMLYGGSGTDRFDGGAGTDTLFGGADADIFHFDRGEGADIIKDFENNVDTIEFDNFGTLTDAQSALNFATEINGDVFFNFGADGTLLVENTTKAQLLDDISIV